VFRNKTKISAKDAGFGEFQKLHVRLLIGFEERRMEIGDAMTAKEGTDAISPDWSALIASDPVLRRTSVALVLEPRIATEANSPPSLSALVMDSLLPAINEGDREALLILFQSFYRLGAYEDFMDRFNGIWSERMRDQSWIDLIGRAYQVAMMLKHPLVGELRDVIDSLGAKEIQTNAEVIARRYEISSRLTPMGREAYRLASVAMDSSAEQDMLWRDAGLIALGYFRILEVELNERFVRPVADGIPLVQLDNVIAAAPTDAKKHWKNALESLKSVASNPSGRWMLGPLRKMFDDFAHPPSHIDINLREFVQSAFEAQLTPTGRDAFYSQELLETISSSRVDSIATLPRMVDSSVFPKRRLVSNS